MTRIATGRLTLRTPHAEDPGSYLASRNQPAALAARHLSLVSTPVARVFPDEPARRSSAMAGWLMLAIEETGTRRMIGETGVFRVVDGLRHGHVGWRLHPDCRGRVIATEAARHLINRFFRALELETIEAACLTGNFPFIARDGAARLAPQTIDQDPGNKPHTS